MLAMKAFKTNVATLVSGTLIPFLLAIIPSMVMAYGYAIWFDINHHYWGLLTADLFFPPLGILHGLKLLLTSWS